MEYVFGGARSVAVDEGENFSAMAGRYEINQRHQQGWAMPDRAALTDEIAEYSLKRRHGKTWQFRYRLKPLIGALLQASMP